MLFIWGWHWEILKVLRNSEQKFSKPYIKSLNSKYRLNCAFARGSVYMHGFKIVQNFSLLIYPILLRILDVSKSWILSYLVYVYKMFIEISSLLQYRRKGHASLYVGIYGLLLFNLTSLSNCFLDHFKDSDPESAPNHQDC